MTDELPRTLADCAVITNDAIDLDRSIQIVPKPAEDELTDKEYVDYHEYRKQFLTYLLNFGKDRSKAQGYSPYTVYADHHRSATFDRWVWHRRGGYHVPPTEDHRGSTRRTKSFVSRETNRARTRETGS